MKQLRLLPGVSEACHALAKAGFVLIVVTNQPDVGRGTLDPRELERMHLRLNELLPLDAIYSCVHVDGDGCPCRKPRPGMILQAAADLGIDLNRSVCVGDRWRDIEAAQSARVYSVLIVRNDREPLRARPDATFQSLYDALETIIGFTGYTARRWNAK